MDSVLDSHPAARVRFSAFPKIYFLRKFNSKRSLVFDVAEINRRQFLECGKLEYVDRTHLVLVRGKLFQKSMPA